MDRIKQTNFGQLDGIAIIETTMTNRNGMAVSSCTYGATLTKILVADYEGKLENVVCGFPSVDGYVQQPQFFGATIGPFAGRLQNAEIQIDEQIFQIQPNEGEHLLHGGTNGFHQAIWRVSVEETIDTASTIYELNYLSDYPAEIHMKVTFTLTDKDELIILYEGTPNADTLLNCTNHSYFNLSGDLKRSIHQQQLKIPAVNFIPINQSGLPLGEVRAVEGTVFDFENGKRLEEIIGANEEQIEFASGGLDHPFILQGREIEFVDEESGRKLTIVTEDQVVVVYTGNKIGDSFDFTEAKAQDFLGVCLEEQNYPNSSLHTHFPHSIVRANECYQKKTIYQFGLKK
ncbi:MAG: galactose mutarotase [Kurthia sp.]|nr:galactose mutarotase [Candidatus Kurthia equi]